MSTITVELDDAVARRISELARAQQRTEQDVVRDAVTAYTAGHTRPLPTGIGKYRSGRTDLSERADEILREAVEGGEWP